LEAPSREEKEEKRKFVVAPPRDAKEGNPHANPSAGRNWLSLNSRETHPPAVGETHFRGTYSREKGPGVLSYWHKSSCDARRTGQTFGGWNDRTSLPGFLFEGGDWAAPSKRMDFRNWLGPVNKPWGIGKSLVVGKNLDGGARGALDLDGWFAWIRPSMRYHIGARITIRFRRQALNTTPNDEGSRKPWVLVTPNSRGDTSVLLQDASRVRYDWGPHFASRCTSLRMLEGRNFCCARDRIFRNLGLCRFR